MATDYDGRLLIEEEDLIGVTPVIGESFITEEDSEFFVDSYSPAEGCPETP